MNLVLNINQYEYTNFLHCDADVLIIALDKFSCGYLKTYTLDELDNVIATIHKENKKVYLALNIICGEDLILNLKEQMNDIKKLEADGYLISDFGIFQLFKEHNLLNKIIFNPVTNITNKYSSLMFNKMGIDHVCLANELNIKDILDIVKYTKGNVEILAQGYYQICNSKRPLLSNFFKNFNIENNSNHYYIKEESRDYAYPIIEIDGETFIYIDKERCVIKYLESLLNLNINYLRIDTVFLSLEESLNHIKLYSSVINKEIIIDEAIQKLEKTNSNLECLDNVSILKKEKNNE